MKDLAKYLRCSGFPMGNCPLDCPYLTKEEIKEGIPIKADIVIDGVEYWTSCDADRIAKDAADYIEQLEKEKKYRWHDLRKDPDDLPRDLDESVMYTCVHLNHLYDPEYPAYYFNLDTAEFGFWRNIYDDATLEFVDCVFDTVSDLGYERVIAWREIEPFEEVE